MVIETWSEGPGGMLTSPDPVSGGIIDCTILDKEWFVVFNNCELDMLEGFACREDAIRAAEEALA